jgi:thiamine transport system substrate-binding protein
MRKFFVFLFFAASLVFAPALAAQDKPVTLTLVTHDSFAVSESVLAQFEKDNNIKIQVLKSGDAGVLVNQAVLSRSNPLGDVLYGVDNTFLSRALKADLFEAYESPLLKDVPKAFILDEKNRVTPVDYGDICLNYDVAYFDKKNLSLPKSLQDLTAPAYKGLLVVENPATSSPGLGFLLATIAQFGETDKYTYLNYWSDLVKNEVYVSDSWSDAYYTQFTAGGGNGTHPLVVSYASSPPFTIDKTTAKPTTASIIADGTCFRQIEFVGILAGTKNVDAARKFVDFMLSVPLQEDVPSQMYVFPVNSKAKLPQDFANFAAIPEKPVVTDIDTINANREKWIQAWTETVLR